MATAEAVDFDLRALVREELATSPLADPTDVAREVAKTVPEEHLREALAACLVDFVRSIASSSRSSTRRTTAGRDDPPSRWKDAGEIYLKFLRQREYIAADGEWKFLGDCTRDDVLAAAEMRFDQARRNTNVGERYQKLAEVMVEHNAAVVADLPQDVALGVLQ